MKEKIYEESPINNSYSEGSFGNHLLLNLNWRLFELGVDINLEDFSYRIMNSDISKTVKIEYVETWGWLAWIRILTEKEEKF